MNYSFIFDFDSTIFPRETLSDILIHSIADNPKKIQLEKQINKVCDQAMNGEISEKESFVRRITLAKPSKIVFENYSQKYKNLIDKNILELLQQIIKNQNQLFVLSGGFREYIIPILSGIIPAENIIANRFPWQLIESQAQNFENFELLNKCDKVEELKKTKKINPSIPIILIGDGMNDYQVYEKGIVDKFIGVGYYALRENIKNNSPVFFQDIALFVNYIQQHYFKI